MESKCTFYLSQKLCADVSPTSGKVEESNLAISFIGLHCGTHIAFKVLSRGLFFLFFSNNSFKNIGLAITFASDWNKAEHGAFSVEGKKSSPVTTVESIMRPEKTVSLSLSTLSSLT